MPPVRLQKTRGEIAGLCAEDTMIGVNYVCISTAFIWVFVIAGPETIMYRSIGYIDFGPGAGKNENIISSRNSIPISLRITFAEPINA
jgi:hypothetical protein